jgi:hypothetical protein
MPSYAHRCCQCNGMVVISDNCLSCKHRQCGKCTLIRMDWTTADPVRPARSQLSGRSNPENHNSTTGPRLTGEEVATQTTTFDDWNRPVYD